MCVETPWKNEEGKAKQPRKGSKAPPRECASSSVGRGDATGSGRNEPDERYLQLEALLGRYGMVEHVGKFVAHELFVQELRHWGAVDLSRLLGVAAGPLRQMLSSLDLRQMIVMLMSNKLASKSKGVCRGPC